MPVTELCSQYQLRNEYPFLRRVALLCLAQISDPPIRLHSLVQPSHSLINTSKPLTKGSFERGILHTHLYPFKRRTIDKIKPTSDALGPDSHFDTSTPYLSRPSKTYHPKLLYLNQLEIRHPQDRGSKGENVRDL